VEKEKGGMGEREEELIRGRKRKKGGDNYWF